MNDYSDMLTVREIAQELRLSESKVWRLIREGDIPAFKFGREYRVRRSDLNEYVRKASTGEKKNEEEDLLDIGA